MISFSCSYRGLGERSNSPNVLTRFTCEKSVCESDIDHLCTSVQHGGMTDKDSGLKKLSVFNGDIVLEGLELVTFGAN